MSFNIPLHFEDLTRPSAAPYQATPSSLRNQPTETLFELLEDDIVPALSQNTQQGQHFNALYTLISRYSNLKLPHRRSLVNLIEQLARSASPSDSNHVKISIYFIAGVAVTASAVPKPCKFWEKTGREAVLESAHSLISSLTNPCTYSSADKDQLSGLLVRMTLQVLEQPSAAKDKNARAVLSRCLSSALLLDPRQRLPAITAFLHALNRHEHLPAPMVDVLVRLAEENTESLKPIVVEFVREIARVPSEDLARDATAAKALAAFMGGLSEKMPDIFRANLALVLSQLEGESYTMRNGVVHVIGALIKAHPNADDPLLDVLLERSHCDVHAFTRSKAMQVWISLAQAKLIPHRLFPVLADMAASRLDDKTAAVRKYASQLLSSLLQANPFGPELRKSHYQEKLDDILKGDPDLTAIPETNETDDPTGDCDNPETAPRRPSSDCENGLIDANGSGSTGRTPTDDDAYPAADNLDNEQEPALSAPPPDSQSILKKRYYSSAVAFITAVESGLGTMYNMLRSKSITDVSEAVALLITAVQFQLEGAAGQAVRKMLPLVLARESNIRKAAVQAYVKLLAPGGIETVDDKDAAMAVAKGLTALGVGATTGELACLEALISAMCTSEDSMVISSAVVAVLWDIFAGRVPGATTEQRQTACILCGMVAADRPETLQQRIQVIETVGLTNPSFARWSCVALCKLPLGSDSDGHLSSLLANLTMTSSDLSTIEQAVTAVFSISTEPESIVGSIIRELAANLHSQPSSVEILDLSRFLLVIGHVAVKELVRIESLVSQVRKAIASHAQNTGNNEEEEQAAAEADRALELAEKELVSPTSLLGRYGKLAREISADGSAPPKLQASAVLCMAKLMCVQEKFCENNLRLLFSILRTAKEPLVRANAVTALGDLAFRFPNLVEPWSSHIYSALQDEDVRVRKNTLMALTHLILNDMIKVKGQIVFLAACILDESTRIADLARLFFHELARKSTNAVYNILPDTISCMSKMDRLSSDGFQQVVSFLVGLMDKEKHADGMIEKLCHRFRTSESERETEDLSYCISQLNISERGVKKLDDNFKSYSAALFNDNVHTNILSAVAKGNKTGASPSCAQVVEELKGKIEALRKSAVPADDSREYSQASSLSEGGCSSTTQEESHPARTRPSRSRPRKKKLSHEIDPEESTESSDSESLSDHSEIRDGEEAGQRSPPEPSAPKVSTRMATKSSKKKRVAVEESDEDLVGQDESLDEEDMGESEDSTEED